MKIRKLHDFASVNEIKKLFECSQAHVCLQMRGGSDRWSFV